MSHSKVNHGRRSFMKLGAASAAGLASGILVAGRAHASERVEHDPDPSALPEDLATFPLGVAAGDASSTSAELWTRTDGVPVPVRLVVWAQTEGTDPRNKSFTQVVHHDVPMRTPGAVQISVDELLPWTEHRYAFYAMNGDKPVSRSRVGRFKTAPTDDMLVPVTLGAVCCTMNGMSQRVLEAAGQRKDIDCLLQLGDTVYADGSRTIADYRARWHDNLARPGYRALRSSTSVVGTWDDHEVDNDWDPETIAPEHLAAAKGAFFEHMPVCRDGECPERMWRKKRWGKTLELFMLDSRGERKRSTSPKQYLSTEQMEWLKKGLKESDAVFKVIGNTVPITRFPKMFSSSIQDRWETFPEQRQELLAFIETEQIPGVLFVAGDFHLAMISKASPHGIGSRTTEILAGPGAQVGHALVPWLFGRQFDWASNKNNVTAMRFDPVREKVTVEFQGDKGEVFHKAAYRKKASLGFERVDDWLLSSRDVDEG